MMTSIRLCGAIIIVAVFCFRIGSVQTATINSDEWIDYKLTHGKVYANTATENIALYYFNYNQGQIVNYNRLQTNGKRRVTLATNQFSDMRFVQFNALFPKTTSPSTIMISDPPVAQTPPASSNLAENWGITITSENQGTVCNSGWAYATAKAVELLQATTAGPDTTIRLSAQNLIDCAGGVNACVKQIPYTAFQYLATYSQPIFPQTSYPNRPTDSQIGMCLTPNTRGTTLAKFSAVNDDNAMMRYIAAGYPVVIEFDPTSFDFMHYKSGIFDPPRTAGGSHHMVVTGYGTDADTSTDYWVVQNSFGTEWGESGTIRIARNAANPLAKSALFPIEFA